MSNGRGLRPRGFTLLTTLWVLTVASAMTVGFAAVGRRAIDATRNRVAMERSHWRAMGCARRVQSAIDDGLAASETEVDAARLWRDVYHAIDASPFLAGCDVTLEAAGARLDLNSASGESMRRLILASDARLPADSMTDAFEDWRDSDDVERPSGAERTWYAAEQAVPPRNAAFENVHELTYVRGFGAAAAIESLVTTDSGRASLANAPLPVLESVPGISPEVAELVVERRSAGAAVNLADLAGSVSADAAAELTAHYADAVRLTTPDPDAWLLTVRGAESPDLAAPMRWRFVRDGRRVRALDVRNLP